jgi:ATP-binding cassette subfamily B protein
LRHLFSLNKYFWKYRWYLLLGILFIVLTNYFRILSPQLTGYVVNVVVHSVEQQKSPTTDHLDTAAVEKEYSGVVRYIVQQFEANPARKILYAGVILLIIAIISGFLCF